MTGILFDEQKKCLVLDGAVTIAKRHGCNKYIEADVVNANSDCAFVCECVYVD